MANHWSDGDEVDLRDQPDAVPGLVGVTINEAQLSETGLVLTLDNGRTLRCLSAYDDENEILFRLT